MGSQLINEEKRLLITVSYAFVMGFTTVGILLTSVFNNAIFIDLTLRFLLISVIPVVIIYRVDSIYHDSHQDETYIKSHLSWICYHYIIYCLGFIIDYLLVRPLLNYFNYNGIDYFVLLLYIWVIWNFVRGFNCAIKQQDALHRYEMLSKLRQLLNRND